jgi:hypothetical protein
MCITYKRLEYRSVIASQRLEILFRYTIPKTGNSFQLHIKETGNNIQVWHAHDRKYHQAHHARDWKCYADIPCQRIEIPSHFTMPETGNTFQVYHANFKSYQSFSGILR